VLGAEVNAVLGLLHPANHGAGQVDPPKMLTELTKLQSHMLCNNISSLTIRQAVYHISHC
jgi:hypothetical protein